MARAIPAPPSRKKETPANVGFESVKSSEKVQFNKKVPASTADGFEMLKIKTKKPIGDLLTEGLELLEAKYGKV